MPRYRGRSGYRRKPQKTSWLPAWFASDITLANDSTTFTHKTVGVVDLSNFNEAEIILERTRGSIMISKAAGGVGQFTVAGCVLPKKYADNAGTISFDLSDPDDGTDFFMWQTFACVGQGTQYWNGREIDSKAKRRVQHGDQLVYAVTGRTIDTSGTNEKYNIGLNLRHLFKFN